jgi:tetratricopeptide (TPR) repeat protein
MRGSFQALSTETQRIARCLPGRCVLLLYLLAYAAPSAFPLNPSTADRIAKIQKLSDQKKWGEVVREVESSPERDAEIDYEYGSALAHLGRWSESRAAFTAGRRLAPRDARFPIELGGVAFKQKRYAEAVRWLRQGLRLSPHDEYANDFLATVYYLAGDTDAALKYWNRIGKPHLENVRTEPGLKIDPALLNRAFLFAPAGTLRLADFLGSQERVKALGVFPAPNWHLNALDDGNIDIDFRGQELDGLGDGKLEALLSTFRGAFYQTAYPEYFNFRGRAVNFTSLVRWDAEKRRLMATVSAPIARNPKFRFQAGVDLRNENWELRQSAEGPAPVMGALNLRRYAGNAQVTSFMSGRWNWVAGAELSDRNYRGVYAGPALPSQVLLSGFELKQHSQLNYQFARIPERRFESTASVTSDLGRIWSSPSHSFEKIQGAVSADWFPQMSGDDYAMHGQVRSGKTFGSVPFDELFMLGMERDNDLWMRAHVGTRDGIKGSAPLGRNYFLANWEIDKRVYSNGYFTVKLSPFLDSGKITDSLPGLGSPRWLWDAGLQAKFRVMGVGFTLIYGKDLRTGHNAIYATAQ